MAKLLLVPENVCLQIVDVQQSLMSKIYEQERVVENVELMIKCARILKTNIVANTQYIKGLGPYVPKLEAIIGDIPRYDKVEFNAVANQPTRAFITALPKSVTTVALVGVETHICIYQTAMGLLEHGLGVWIVSDAVSSRKLSDHQTGLARLQDVGAMIGSAEMLIYELLGKAGTTEFKEVLPHIIARNE